VTCLHLRISEFETRFEGSVGVDRSEITKEGIPNRRTSNAERGKSNVGTILGKEIEGGTAKLTR